MSAKFAITKNISINKDWWDFFESTKLQEKITSICIQLEDVYLISTTFPTIENIFKSLEYTSPNNIKVIIIGQDPYHGDDEATGLSFHVNNHVKKPPSLKNIYKEIALEYNINLAEKQINLEDWAQQGVLLLNSILTVEKDKPGSHKFLNWEEITTEIIQLLSIKSEKKVYLLWGKYSENKKIHINEDTNLVLTSSHPSPFSAHRGFLGNNHFIKTNEYLVNHNIQQINWFK